MKAGGIGYEPEQHPTLRAGSNLASTGAVMQSVAIAANQRGEVRLDGADGQTVFQREESDLERYIVRRLTPTECERLQGFPDGWTDVSDFDGKPMSDAQRYKQLGNSMAVPVMRWIGERILDADMEEEE